LDSITSGTVLYKGKDISKVCGKKDVLEFRKSMGGEDFAYYLEKVPGCFMYLGVKNAEKGCIYPGHNTKFTIDEDAFSMGITMMLNGALCFQKLVENRKKKLKISN
jgi:Metal-dependent amidase/aminoacylase/carboxypeptidase